MPKIFNKQEVLDRLNSYIDSIPDPMLQEFCIDRDNPTRETINTWINDDKDKYSNLFSDAVKRLLAKQEIFLTRAKDINPVMAIFRLKQPVFGYRDKQDVAIDATVTQTIKPIIQD